MIEKDTNGFRGMMVGLMLVGLIASPLVALVAAKGSPACNDGVDNDEDGLVDYPADPGCENKGDKAEADGSSKPSQSRTYRASWITGHCDVDVWVAGTPLAGVTDGEFPIRGEDVGRPFTISITVSPPPLGSPSFVLSWLPDGSVLAEIWGKAFGGTAMTHTFKGKFPATPGTLIASECGSTASSAVLVVS